MAHLDICIIRTRKTRQKKITEDKKTRESSQVIFKSKPDDVIGTHIEGRYRCLPRRRLMADLILQGRGKKKISCCSVLCIRITVGLPLSHFIFFFFVFLFSRSFLHSTFYLLVFPSACAANIVTPSNTVTPREEGLVFFLSLHVRRV